MMTEPPLDQPDPHATGDTVRIDRRHSVLAQIEAALLADKLQIEEPEAQRATGSDPYNSGKDPRASDAGIWPGKRR